MQKYSLFIEQAAHQERKNLPGHMRQRIQRAIDDLSENPYPPNSQQLDTTGLDIPATIAIYRIRLEKWRIVYVVNESEAWIWVWAIRRRPPYDYQDLAELLDDFEPMK